MTNETETAEQAQSQSQELQALPIDLNSLLGQGFSAGILSVFDRLG